MRKDADVAIALPGGIGTLDEVIETLVLAKLDLFRGRIFALDVDGFYEPFVRLLDHYVETGMLDEGSRAMIRFPKTVERMMEEISK
jgi:predicted Rossmann-fold nucleotide-binding protein